MGSFSEVVLSFDFRPSTPDDVLTTFSALASDGPLATAPPLPAPVIEAWDMFEPDWREAGTHDPYLNEPWRHDWAGWMSTAMGVTTTPHGRLVWSTTERWNLGCRFSWNTGPRGVSEAIEWLAPYVDDTHVGGPALIGYAHFEYAPKPHLFWVEDGAWVMEDLNPNDDWAW